MVFASAWRLLKLIMIHPHEEDETDGTPAESTAYAAGGSAWSAKGIASETEGRCGGSSAAEARLRFAVDDRGKTTRERDARGHVRGDPGARWLGTRSVKVSTISSFHRPNIFLFEWELQLITKAAPKVEGEADALRH